MDVNETSSVAGLITPGCRVDIVLDAPGADNDHMVSRTVAQDVQVVAVGQRLSAQHPEGEKDNGYHSITLLATPHNAELIGLASNTTRFRMVLRGVNDKGALRQRRRHLRRTPADTHRPMRRRCRFSVRATLAGPATNPAMTVEFPSPARMHHTTQS